jgi:DNA-binding NarL/FixJ family response regulator
MRTLSEITVLIADDHPIVREGLRLALAAAPGLCLVAEAGDGEQALRQLRQLRPHVAVLDIDMPLLDGFRVAEIMRTEVLPSKVIFLTIHGDASFLDRALKVGAQGYLLKDAAPNEIVAAIKAVEQGQSYLSPAMTKQLIDRRTSSEQVAALARLTPTERAVIKFIAECRTTKEIAAQLSISPRTVETHRANICQKLGLRGNHALTRFALAHQVKL